MNKILKIIMKPDPIFKYIVEDYPFYEGIFFHPIDFHKINILKTHYILRQKLNINQGTLDNLYKSKLRLRLTPFINSGIYKLKITPKLKLKKPINFRVLSTLKIDTKLNLKFTMSDKNYSKSTVTLHIIKLIKLKTHDPYPLENRDMLSLSNMDEEKII